MRCLGLMSPYGWQAAAYYMDAINAEVRNRSGGLHTAKLVLCCLDSQETDRLVVRQDWAALGSFLGETARKLVAAGAEGLLLTSLTLHRCAADIMAAVPVPFLDIVDPLEAEFCRSKSRPKRLGILGPSAALQPGPLLDRLTSGKKRRIVTPPVPTAARLDENLFNELCHGLVREEAREETLRAIAELRSIQVGTVVLGCPELATLLTPEDYRSNYFNAPEIHALAAVDWMFGAETTAVVPRPKSSLARAMIA